MKSHAENPIAGKPLNWCAPAMTLPLARSTAVEVARLVSPGPLGESVKFPKPSCTVDVIVGLKNGTTLDEPKTSDGFDGLTNGALVEPLVQDTMFADQQAGGGGAEGGFSG